MSESDLSGENPANLEEVFQRIRSNDPADIANLERSFNVSPQLVRLGFTIDLGDPERPICRIPEVREFHLGGVGLPAVNGGVSSALCDLSIGVTGLAYLDRGLIATARLNIRFMQPLIARSVVARSWVHAVRGNRLFSRTELANEKGAVCVKASGVVVIGIRRGK